MVKSAMKDEVGAMAVPLGRVTGQRFRVTFDRMDVIEAEFNDGVLRPMRRLPLRPGEKVGIVVIRRPDPLRWDLTRLSKVIPAEDTLTEAGLSDWETTLSHEDRS
jgi:predicted DNA-binding antitoxin AbrB/MazE fold protein